ncbi:MAG TPA: hypothetical protein VIL03_06390 [Clostridia bacterium]|jgi:predicted P-loop ATPase
MIEVVAPIFIIIFIGLSVAVVLYFISQQSKDATGNNANKGFFKDLFEAINEKDLDAPLHLDEESVEEYNEIDVKPLKKATTKIEASKVENARLSAKLEQKQERYDKIINKPQSKVLLKASKLTDQEPKEELEVKKNDLVEIFDEDGDVLKKLVLGEIIMTPKYKKGNFKKLF